MRRAAVWSLVIGLIAAGCGSASASVVVSPPPSSSAVADLVGEWVGSHDCLKIVEALREAGFDESKVLDAVLGNELVPGATSPEDLADPATPCTDAVPREHSHFFTADGLFGSRDFRGQQVDDGLYEIVGPGTFVIGDTTFHYSIDGDKLMMEPVVPAGCLTDDCAWSIMVGMAGTPMQRR